MLSESRISGTQYSDNTKEMASSVDREETRPLQKRIWYRTTLFNAFVIGGVGFLAPGLWNAMSALGAGGAQSPFLVNAANSLVFGLSMPFHAIPLIAFFSGSCFL